MRFIIALMAIICPVYAFGEFLTYKHAYEVTGKNINIREIPDGQVIDKISAPGIVIHGIPEEGALGGEQWTSLVDLSGYDNGYISSRYVKPVPFRKFDSSFCGSYVGQGNLPMDDYSYSIATIEQKPHGWYVMTIRDYSQPREEDGMRSFFTRVLAGKTFQSMEADPSDRMNDFDGIWFFVELWQSSDLDDIKADEYPSNILGEVEDEYYIVTGDGELTSRYIRLKKDVE